MKRICLAMVLYAEIWPKRPILKCKDCPMREGCTHEAKETDDDKK